jgi:hypothetical protein
MANAGINQLSVAANCIANHLRQRFAVVVRRVIAIAVGRFDQHDVGGRRRGWIGEHGAAVATEIAAEQDRRTAGETRQHVGGAKQVTGRRHFYGHAGRHLRRLLIRDRLQVCQRPQRISFVVERQGCRVFRVAVLVRLPRVLLLDPAGIRKHQAAQVGGTGGAEHRPPEPLRDQPREVADVIQVSVRQHDRVDRVRSDRKIFPVAQPQFLEPLEQPAVEQHARAGVLDQVFRSGHGASRPEKRQLSHPQTIPLRFLQPGAPEP